MLDLRHALRRLAVPALAACSTLLVGACGGSGTTGSTADSSGSPSTTTSATATSSAAAEHNDADVAFATGMIPHHRQAIAMADMAAIRADSREVKALAARIKAAQDPEITRMSGWLRQWGQQVPTGSGMGSMGGSGHTSSGATGDQHGMMSNHDMEQLGMGSGAAFDRAFLTAMVAHHQGAVAMAEAELRDGVNKDAEQLAQSIIASQTAEIAEMQQLLRRLS